MLLLKCFAITYITIVFIIILHYFFIFIFSGFSLSYMYHSHDFRYFRYIWYWLHTRKPCQGAFKNTQKPPSFHAGWSCLISLLSLLYYLFHFSTFDDTYTQIFRVYHISIYQKNFSFCRLSLLKISFIAFIIFIWFIPASQPHQPPCHLFSINFI